MLSIIAVVLFLISCVMSFTNVIRLSRGESQVFPGEVTLGLIIIGWICLIISWVL
jgi:hypothetical protein